MNREFVNTVGEGLIAALEQAVEYEKGKKVKGTTLRKMSTAPLTDYKAPKIKEIRKRLGISQSTFAYVIGVSKKTIEAWECGRNKPQGPAQSAVRFLIRGTLSQKGFDKSNPYGGFLTGRLLMTGG